MDFPLCLLIFIWLSITARVFLLLLIFFNLILSLQKELISNFYLDFDGVALTSEPTRDECGLAIIMLARDAFYRESLRGAMGS